MRTLTVISKSEEETKRFAARLAKRLALNDCLALMGDFGSGKTTFVKGLAKGLGFRKKNYVCSPSFVILKIYPSRVPIYHFDLYRLNKYADIENIGLNDFMQGCGVSVIEWAEKIKQFLPKGHLKVQFSILKPGIRRIKFSTSNNRLSRHLLKLEGKKQAK